MNSTFNNRFITDKIHSFDRPKLPLDQGYSKEFLDSEWAYAPRSEMKVVVGFERSSNKDYDHFNQQLKEERTELESLVANWDENDALKPESENIENALAFLKKAFKSLSDQQNLILSFPEINACPDGSIDVVWRLSEAFMLINFRNPASKIAYFYFDKYREELGRQGGIELDKPLPDDVVGYLTALSR
ncbi:MAG: hypothetical protein EA392_14320 [Cryomorphaceae bacterium]|nr:MAG: hypothetical protein EA392_14320 [Cryomorphaceae bacterium]